MLVKLHALGSELVDLSAKKDFMKQDEEFGFIDSTVLEHMVCETISQQLEG